jgi:hypothetical protein
MRLIIADIHVNIDALEKVDESYDCLLVLGDFIDYGAAPEEGVRWLCDRSFEGRSGLSV